MAETVSKSSTELAQENEYLRAQLAEAQEVIRAIQSGEVDAVVVSGPQGEQVFTLQGAEYAYRVLVEAMNEGAASLDADGTVLYCNQRLADMCGVPLEQVVGGRAVRLVDTASRDEFEELLAGALDGEAAKGEFTLRSGDGLDIPVYVSVRKFKADENAALCMVVTDLSEQRKQRELLAKEEALRKHAELLTLSYDAIIVWRLDAGIESWNVGAEKLYGYTESEALGQVTHELLRTVHPRPWPEVRAELFEKGFWEGELRHFTRDGREIVVSARKQIVEVDDGTKRVLEINRDITERNRAEEAIRSARLEAERSATQLRTVLDNMAERLYVCDGEGNLLIANATARETYDPESASNAPSAFDMPDHIEVLDIFRRPLPRAEWPISRVLRGERVRSSEIRVRFKRTGLTRTLSCNGSAIKDAHGKIVMAVLTSEDITERKVAESRLRRFYETDLFAILYWRLDGGVIDVNNKFLEMTGYNRADLDAGLLNWSHMTPPEYHPMDEDARKQIRETGVHRPYEKEFIRKDGSRVWGLFSAAAWEDSPNEGVSFIVDITERKKAEEALRLATERFQVALRDSPIVVFNQDLDLRYTWIYNPALGYGSSDVLGKSDAEVFERPEDAVVTDAIKAEVIRTGKSRRQEVVVHWDGVDCCYDLLVDPLVDERGQVAGVTCAAIDITERKQAEAELRRSKERLELAVEVASLGEWDVDLVSGSATHSARHALIFGYPAAERDWSIERFIEHILPEHREEVLRKIKDCVNSGGLDFEVPMRRVDGELRWIWVRGRCWPEGEVPTRMYGTIMDITERKRVEQGLIQSEKLASVGRMASSIAHEINNPLETIGNAVFLAVTNPGISEDAKAYLELASQELERVTHISKQTLAFHRSEKKPTAIELRECIEGLVKLFAPRLKSRGITVQKLYKDVGPILATSGEVQQVVSNLLTNSMDAMTGAGTIQLRLSRTLGRNGQKAVRFTIADTGSGIPADRLTRIFDAFFTTKEMVGTGLGLWVTKQILEKYGATIQVRSKTGRGTMFSVVFPAAKAVPER
jgi:PAS domain S-box-containing protein